VEVRWQEMYAKLRDRMQIYGHLISSVELDDAVDFTQIRVRSRLSRFRAGICKGAPEKHGAGFVNMLRGVDGVFRQHV